MLSYFNERGGGEKRTNGCGEENNWFLGAEKSNMGAEKSNMGAEKSNMGAEKSNMGAEKSNMGAEKSNMGAEKRKLYFGATVRHNNFRTNDFSIL